MHTNVEEIYIEAVASGAGRSLRGQHVNLTRALIKVDVVAKRNLGVREISENTNITTNNTTLVPFKGLYCDCTSRLPTDSNFYCPVTSKSCEVWRGFSGSDDYSVSCTNENWMVAYARYMWYYLIFWFAFLVLSLILTAPGQHAIKYVLSRRFPGINNRIADLIIELDNNRYMQNQMGIAYERHLQRQRDGWVSGYKLKTKRYSFRDNDAKDHDDDLKSEQDGEKQTCEECVVNKNVIDLDAELNKEAVVLETENAGCDNSVGSLLNDLSENSADNNMCTICLLDIEDGDIIADVKCGHLYHADCLSEWILKKVRENDNFSHYYSPDYVGKKLKNFQNSCPLCQAPDVAEEVREFESADFHRSNSSGISENRYPDTPMGQMRRRLHLAAVGDGYSMFGVGGRQYSDDQRGFLTPFF